MPDNNVTRLRRLDCCAVSDALDKLGLPGAVIGLPQRSGHGRIAGRAITVKLGVGNPPPGPPRHLGCTAIEQADSENIIVVEQQAVPNAGCWGGLLSLGAKMRGVAGVVADGPVRDIDEAIAYGFSVYARSLTSMTARGRVVEQGTNIPVDVGGVTVQAGDYVIADNSAVLIIPAARIEEVLDAAEMIVAQEARMAKAILTSAPIGQVMGGNYENMLK